jgi:hypothetical protein
MEDGKPPMIMKITNQIQPWLSIVVSHGGKRRESEGKEVTFL